MASKKQTVTPLRTEPHGIATITYRKDGRPPMTRPFGLNWAARNSYPTGEICKQDATTEARKKLDEFIRNV